MTTHPGLFLVDDECWCEPENDQRFSDSINTRALCSERHLDELASVEPSYQ